MRAVAHEYNEKFVTGSSYHSRSVSFRASRSFHGVGPSISWNASAPVAGAADRARSCWIRAAVCKFGGPAENGNNSNFLGTKSLRIASNVGLIQGFAGRRQANGALKLFLDLIESVLRKRRELWPRRFKMLRAVLGGV
jgi:hypothetical protein